MGHSTREIPRSYGIQTGNKSLRSYVSSNDENEQVSHQRVKSSPLPTDTHNPREVASALAVSCLGYLIEGKDHFPSIRYIIPSIRAGGLFRPTNTINATSRRRSRKFHLLNRNSSSITSLPPPSRHSLLHQIFYLYSRGDNALVTHLGLPMFMDGDDHLLTGGSDAR
ncbi:hypothetical protein EVAR_84431_1 [Eumeta japonica]|uniref:Uncharacterized protein n=1 Tax=Eumeta variegata TaxID=151549 RepID=A0A4C1W269_EUMVA|nr:hypothetical protein EVAR_84431_1 [Eumeta japonica]